MRSSTRAKRSSLRLFLGRFQRLRVDDSPCTLVLAMFERHTLPCVV